MKELIEKILKIQNSLDVPKSHYNDFGGYHYRNCEDILNAIKPLLAKQGLLQTISDQMLLVGDKRYVKATVTVTDGTDSVTATAFAREAEDRKKMNPPQLTGSASSYARKYALNGMWNIDDVKDADTHEMPKNGQQNGQAKSSKDDGKKWLNKTGYQSDELTDDWKNVCKALRENKADMQDVLKKFKVNKDSYKELQGIAS